ncbi:MAG TPA: hypothetical protein VIK35_12310 [Verrucomicrobiae bacterium]
MSAIELIAERSRSLTEVQAETILVCMDALAENPTPNARDLMNLPPNIRRKILSQQVARAEKVYRNNPDLIVEENEPPLEHE